MKKQRLAIAQFYEPFTMGGSVWQMCAFPVEAERVRLYGFEGFVWLDPEGFYRVHEAGTGGFLADHRDKREAIRQANHNIRITPDFRKQCKQVGSASGKRKIAFQDAWRRLAKSKDKEMRRRHG